MNSWEGMTWNNLPGWSVTGVCSQHNLHSLDGLTYPVTRLNSSADSRLWHGIEQIFLGRQQRMIGLEKLLTTATIAHTAEIYYYYTQQAVLAKQKNPGLRVVATVWDNSPRRFGAGEWPGPGKAPRWWEKKVAARIAACATGVDYFLPVSQSAAAVLAGYGVSERKLRVVTPAIIPQAVEPNQVVSGLLADSRSFWLVVNRLVPEKGVSDIIEAWATYPARMAERLVIVGQGPERATLAAMVKKYALGDSVVFVDHIPNAALRPLYQAALSLVLASRPTPLWEEQFGYVLAEAISAHCPVIATNTGAIPEVVGQAGILVKPNSPADLCAAWQTMRNPTARAGLVRQASVQANRFSVSLFQTELLRVYDSLL